MPQLASQTDLLLEECLDAVSFVRLPASVLSQHCLDCDVAEKVSESAEMSLPPNGTPKSENLDEHGVDVRPTTASRLIEFPGVTRSSMPQWRKELSERVREVQEKRAREAALEKAEEEKRSKRESARASGKSAPAPQLELLPQAEVPPLNPIVSAALRRIERAHQQVPLSDVPSPRPQAIAAVALARNDDFGEANLDIESGVTVATVDLVGECSTAVPELESQATEKVHNLVVVQSRIGTADAMSQTKPRRMISDDPNDPALNYLDSVPTALRVENVRHKHAPAFVRLLAAIVDLILVAVLSAPFAATLELLNPGWQRWAVLAFSLGIFSVVIFLYLTVSTALTGRTLGTTIFSLRIVDSRTGLIPTGKQSAGRALIYVATLLTLGLAAIYALIDSDRRTAHDRFTRTAVIAV